jgi:dTDP-4-dehydrorhamnose reductase
MEVLKTAWLNMQSVLRCIANNSTYHHPAFQREGWWQRNTRLLYRAGEDDDNDKCVKTDSNTQPVLILGKTGTLGNAFARICDARNIVYKLLSREDLDICNPKMIQKAISDHNPWAIINATGYVNVMPLKTIV